MMNQPNVPENAPVYYPPDADTVAMKAPEQDVQVANNQGVVAESQRESYVDSSGHRVERKIETYEDKNLRKVYLRYWLTSIIYFLLGVLEVILGLRFLFRLFGAHEDNDFIVTLYNFTHVFVGPFNNVFNDQTIGSRSVFEFSTLVAMLIYALIAWGLVALVRVLLTPTYDTGQEISVRRRRFW